MRKLIYAVAAVLAVGCAHGRTGEKDAAPEGNPNAVVLRKLKGIAPKTTETGVVVLYRNTRFGSILGPINFNGTLWLDDQAAGDVGDDKYNVLELPAGRHSFRVMGTVGGAVMQASTVVNVAAGETKLLELMSVQEWNNATVKFQQGGTLEAIATDCTEGFELDLSPTPATAKSPGPAPTRM